MEKRTQRKRRMRGIGAVDKLTGQIMAVLLLFLVATQVSLFALPKSGKYLNSALRMEGEPITSTELAAAAGAVTAAPWAILHLRLDGYTSRPEAKVCVNGRDVADFRQCEVTINVRHKDQITVKCARADQEITVYIAKTTPNVERPRAESSVSGRGVIHLDSVVVK